MADTPTIDEQIAAVKHEVSRMEDNERDWHMYLEGLSPGTMGYKSAVISLRHLVCLRGALATLQQHECVTATLRVIANERWALVSDIQEMARAALDTAESPENG